MSKDFIFSIKSICFDENYHPSDSTRLTTNFANLARGKSRQENLRNTLRMIDNRFNSLAHWDNPNGDRYAVELDIISVELNMDVEGSNIPLIEILKPNIIDKKTNERIDGIAGNNFSSYVRDYDFSVLLPEHNNNKSTFGTPDNFGDFHGKLFKHFVRSNTYKAHFSKPPVICISASSSKTYQRTENQHPSWASSINKMSSPRRMNISRKWGCKCAISCRRTAPRRWLFTLSATCWPTTAILN